MTQDIGFELAIKVRWLVPSDPAFLGREAHTLATSIRRISPFQKKLITQPVYDGFAENFRTQSAAGQPWQQLAERTRDERLALMHDPSMSGKLVPGFNPWQPILQRTGDYRSSWVDRDHPDHVEDWHEGPRGQAPQFGSNLITIELGSDHRHMAKLSGGSQGAPVSGPGGFDIEGMEGYLPSRRVDIIEDQYSETVGRRITINLSEEARRVKVIPGP